MIGLKMWILYSFTAYDFAGPLMIIPVYNVNPYERGSYAMNKA